MTRSLRSIVAICFLIQFGFVVAAECNCGCKATIIGYGYLNQMNPQDPNDDVKTCWVFQSLNGINGWLLADSAQDGYEHAPYALGGSVNVGTTFNCAFTCSGNETKMQEVEVTDYDGIIYNGTFAKFGCEVYAQEPGTPVSCE